MSALEKYSSYKDSGVEWLGEIPEHWELIRLCNLGSFSASGIDKLIVKNESKVQIINYTDIYSNINHTISSKKPFMIVTTPESNRIKHLVNKGDLIFLPSSETYEDLGLSALVNEDIKNLSYSYHVLRFKFKMKVYHEYKKYLTNNHFVLNNFSKEGTGSIRKTIGRFVFRNSKVILPPYEEQTKIANYLDKKIAQIDQAIEQKEELITLLKERRQILIHKAVTQGLDSTVKMKDSGVEWIGEIPEHWKMEKVKYIFNLIIDPAPINNKFELLSIYTDIGVKPRKDLAAKGNKASTTDGYWKVKKGDFIVNKLLAWMGAVGLSEYDGVTSPAYDILRAINPIEGVYFHELFRMKSFTQEMKKHSRGIMDMRLRLYFDKFGDIRVPLPPLEEQKEIVQYIKINSDKIENAIGLQEETIVKLKEYKNTLIDSCVTGKVKIT